MEKTYHITSENAREMQAKSVAARKQNRIFQTEALKHAKEIAQGLRVLAKSAATGDRTALADLYRYTGEERQQIDITSNGQTVNFVVPQEAKDILDEIADGADGQDE